MAATYSMKSMIRGFHVCPSVWSPITGEELHCVRELSNAEDALAVAVMKNSTVVGHIPRKMSSRCSIFHQLLCQNSDIEPLQLIARGDQTCLIVRVKVQ